MSWRRLWAGVGMLLALVLAVRLVWGWWVARQLRAQLDELRKRGEPVELADLVPAPISDAQNAWVVQLQAAASLASGVDSPRNSTLEYRDYPPYSSEWFKLAEASEKANTPAFALARKARRLERAQTSGNQGLWPVVGNLNPARHLANTLCDAATYAHLTGDDAEAIERLLDVLHVSRSLYHSEYFVSTLVAYGIDALACDATNVIGPGLRFEAGATTRPAQRQQVRQLIARLLDEKLAVAGNRWGMMTERVNWIDEYRKLSVGIWFIRPLADREMIRQNRNFDIALEACACTNWPDAQEVCRGYSFEPLMAPQPTFVWSNGGLMPAVEPVRPRYSRWFYNDFFQPAAFERYFRGIGERRATAVGLACQLYRVDHGRWPERLEQLVPAYLAAIPQDPFHSDKRPLGYVVLKGKLPGGGDRPLIYYDGGEVDAPIPDEPTYDWQTDQRPGHRATIRQYRDVTRFVPPPKPVIRYPAAWSTKAVNRNPQKSNAPRQQAKD